MDKQTVSIVLTVDETNMVLGALGTQSFNTVAALIQSIKMQAESQLKPAEPAGDAS